MNVIIKNITQQETNIHLAVHPFRNTGGIVMMSWKGHYGTTIGEQEPMAEWKQRLADSLWDDLPGLRTLFFTNGGITLQHGGIFNDDEIIKLAEEIIRPVLETQALLESL